MPLRAKRYTSYLRAVWDARYFWLHLVGADLRSKWRRSYLGPLWAVIQPLVMALLLALVLGRVFKTEILGYIPYVLSGTIVWEIVSGSLVGGSLAFVQADAYIRQCRRPLAIYTLRTVLVSLTVGSVAMIGLLTCVIVIAPGSFGWSWLAALAFPPVVTLLIWPVVTIAAYLGVRFRDLPNALGLMLQAAWFVSPVYFEARLFREGGLGALVDYNPIYHLLELLRAPLLRGEWPGAANYLFCAGTALVAWLVAWLLGGRMERKVIYYL